VNDYLLEAVGWIGSALLVYSVLQTRFLRFRVLNGIASGVLVAYNAVVGVWPMVGVNAVLVFIDAYFLWTLRRDKKQAKAFTFVAADPALLGWFTARFGDDLARFHPGYAPLETPAAEAVVLFHEDRAIGLAAWRRTTADDAELLADYVIPAYRDFAPGGFVYSPAGPFRHAGVAVLTAEQPTPAVAAYLGKVGFKETAPGRLALTL
jgi:hypothetical protein